MEGNVTERRLSVAVTPLWLDSSNTSVGLPALVAHDISREMSPRPETIEDGFPPNKVQITTDVPRILIPPRHRGVVENFENTEVEELIAMLRETENLEDQGDILQYLVDTQGLDYNTGDYRQHYAVMASRSSKLSTRDSFNWLTSSIHYFFRFHCAKFKDQRV